ncbi:MAG: methionyl-tRNA formyltransferase, partial [Planctomycetota bacterium]|nr:methionyl-tRNA formyltransferase [Planctomycetota bacterium]
MRIVMMGTGPFAVPTFEWLLRSGHDIPALVTRPVPASRGRQKLPANPMRDVGVRLAGQIKILEPASVNDPACIAELRELQADLWVVCDYGQILKRETLAAARWGGINLHASLLPQYRGAAPIHWAIYHGECETGVTVIHMSPRLDAGPCLVQYRVPIGQHETSVQLEQRLSELGVTAVREIVNHLAEHGEFPAGIQQDESLASLAPRLTKNDGTVDWTQSAQQIHRQVQAFFPWPGVYTDWHRAGQAPVRILLDRVTHVDQPHGSQNLPAGTVVNLPLGSPSAPLLIQTGAGLLAIEELHPAGKKPMRAAEFQ